MSTNTSSPVSVSISGSNPVSVSVSGGIGPQGPSGVTTVDNASDVEVTGKNDGDLLRWSNGKWRNYPESSVLDGGNF
jgi:hypothetical protein